MMHSSPRPLKTALDIVKRLRHELERHMTPEQRRDFARLEQLFNRAQRVHDAELVRAGKQVQAPDPPAAAKGRRRVWGRITSML